MLVRVVQFIIILGAFHVWAKLLGTIKNNSFYPKAHIFQAIKSWDLHDLKTGVQPISSFSQVDFINFTMARANPALFFCLPPQQINLLSPGFSSRDY